VGWILALAIFILIVLLTAGYLSYIEYSGCETDSLEGYLHPFPNNAKSADSTPRLPGCGLFGEEERRGFVSVWHMIQKRFEVDPSVALIYADVIISALIRRLESQSHAPNAHQPYPDARIREQYRLAHEVTMHTTQQPVSRGQLRVAFDTYTSLFNCLSEERGDERKAA
jgi:hypothetical protein